MIPMKYFFPDSQDQIDPRFDFLTEETYAHRVRQRDELYAHEVLSEPPYDGILVSKAIVDGLGSAGRFAAGHRNRLYRDRVHRFYRLDRGDRQLLAMGDCGAFAYVREPEPPYSVDDVIDFYDGCGFDLGFSLDHIVLDYDPEGPVDSNWEQRQQLTLELAQQFLDRHAVRGCSFKPIGVAQGWSPASYAAAVSRLQEIGYDRVALGGMVPLKTPAILATLDEVAKVLHPGAHLHLLGVTRVESIPLFRDQGVTSFDSTSPFRQAFMDADDNYYALDRHYCAIRIPPSDGNARVRKKIQSGALVQEEVRRLESEALRCVREYAEGRAALAVTVEAVSAYERLIAGEAKHERGHAETLAARPWEACDCAICESAGVETVIFRGTERNKRRGFHNLHIFRQQLERLPAFA